MKPKFWHTERFKELEKEWYSRLERENFNDIEKQINGSHVLKQRADNCYRQEIQIRREAKERYYELLSQGYHLELHFEDEVEDFVMHSRMSGVKLITICEQLRWARERCYRGTIRKIIQKYERLWLIKK